MDIKKLAKQIHRINIKKGFWKEKGNEGQRLFLVITELAEMCEADRKDRNGSIQLFEIDMARQSKFKYSKKQKLEIKIDRFEKHIKDSVGDELADAFIRMCDYCMGFKVEINEKYIREQIERLESFPLKFNNLGEELLNVSGLITEMHTRQDRTSYIYLIFARLLWLADQLKMPLEKHIQLKMWYNSTRGTMHGKKY